MSLHGVEPVISILSVPWIASASVLLTVIYCDSFMTSAVFVKSHYIAYYFYFVLFWGLGSRCVLLEFFPGEQCLPLLLRSQHQTAWNQWIYQISQSISEGSSPKQVTPEKQLSSSSEPPIDGVPGMYSLAFPQDFLQFRWCYIQREVLGSGWILRRVSRLSSPP